MAENILGLLFVTSSSRGRHVFRYPPDPASPNVRLAQPVYSAATYTATEPDIDFRGDAAAFRRKLFGPGVSSGPAADGSAFSSGIGLGSISNRGAGEDRSSNHSGGAVSKKLGGSRKRDGNGRDDLQARYMNYQAGSDYEQQEGEEDTDASSSEYDSDYDFEWNTAAGGAAGTGITGGIIAAAAGGNRQNKRNDSDATTSGLKSLETSTVIDASRRGSASTTTELGGDSSSHAINGDQKKAAAATVGGEDRFMEGQYNYALGYPLSFLSDMLTPPRAACNRKFEMNVESLVFIGHPVCCGPDGKWEAPAEDDEVEERGVPSRGRRMHESSQGPTLTTLHEHKESSSSASSASPDVQGAADSAAAAGRAADTPSLNMFHLVLIVDKPDPRPGQGQESHDDHHSQTLGLYDEVYREIAFKWTAAAYKLQCESNFIAKQAWEMARFKERCLSDGVPIIDCCRDLSRLSALNRSLDLLYLNLHRMRQRPVNPLYSYLPTTINTTLLDMNISMVLSPRLVDNDEEWAHWGEMEGEEMSDSDSDTSDRRGQWDDPTCPIKRPELRVEPWQTLLLVDDDATAKANEISIAVLGLGLGMEDTTPTPVVAAAAGQPPGDRRGSRGTVTTTAEEDETALMKALIEACDVTKPLGEIAHTLRFDLEGIVIPLARELVQSKRAIIIDVVNTRLRTVVMPTTVEEHSSSIDQYASRFQREFPSLPPFPQFIAAISANPTAFKDLLPPDANQLTRQTYMNALTWLLKQDLVVQAHTRARIFARKEVKIEAWKRLWKKKREAWLTKLKEKEEAEAVAQAMGSPSISISGEEMITPKAVENGNPLDLQRSAPIPTIPPPAHADQSLHFDPDLELDSDDDVDGDGDGDGQASNSGFAWNFDADTDEPTRLEIPKFTSSFIFKPSRAQKDEARWIKVIRESADELWASKFDLCVQYLDGVSTFEEIAYRTGLPRRELDKILQLYKDDIVTFLHP